MESFFPEFAYENELSPQTGTCRLVCASPLRSTWCDRLSRAWLSISAGALRSKRRQIRFIPQIHAVAFPAENLLRARTASDRQTDGVDRKSPDRQSVHRTDSIVRELEELILHRFEAAAPYRVRRTP